jgi:hypothetical protein
MSTPLLDFFRRGEVARDVRLLAAQGALAPRAHEQLGLLALLVSDADPEVARAAEATIAAIPRPALSAFLARSDASAEIRSFFAARGIEPGVAVAPATAAPVPAGAPAAEAASSAAPDAAPAGDQPLVDASSASANDDAGDEQSTVQRLSSMSVAQRLTRAIKGSREERAILIRDPNKLVSAAVLSSPKVSETEVEAFARMANVSEEVLRVIGSTRAWMKNYAIMSALTRNPKTPVAMSMNMLARLNDRDLRQLSTDRNVPDVLRITARKKLSTAK